MFSCSLFTFVYFPFSLTLKFSSPVRERNSSYTNIGRRQNLLLTLELGKSRSFLLSSLQQKTGDRQRIGQAEGLSETWNQKLAALVMRHPFWLWKRPHPFAMVATEVHPVLTSSHVDDRSDKVWSPGVSGGSSSVLTRTVQWCDLGLIRAAWSLFSRVHFLSLVLMPPRLFCKRP